MGPDSGIGLTQHFGLCVRWLDTIPLGGASAVAALRRAARAVQAGDADVVACVAGDTNHVDFLPPHAGELLALHSGRGLSLWRGRRECRASR